MTSGRRTLLALFGLLGLVASAMATWVHYHLIINPDYTSFCDVNTTISCSQAYLSRYGSIAGVPVALGGVFFFTLVLMLVWAARATSRVGDSAASYIFILSVPALAFILYLASVSFFTLRQVCPLCVLTYIGVLGVFVVSATATSVPVRSVPARAARDMGLLVTTPLALVIALVFLSGAGSAVALFPAPEIRPVVQIQPLPDDQRRDLERWYDLQPKVTVPYSSDGAAVLVVIFSDYQCPGCRAVHFGYEPVFAKYKDHPNDLKFVLKHFPLNPQCNAAVHGIVHPASCAAAAAAEMARGNGSFDKLSDWFFVHQDELSPATVRRAAREVGGISDFDARYASVIPAVEKDASAGAALGVDQTPTIIINGHKLRAVTPPAFDALIDMELKRVKQSVSNKPQAVPTGR